MPKSVNPELNKFGADFNKLLTKSHKNQTINTKV